jgi:hypothetical protein
VIIPWSADEVGNGQTDGAGDPINPVYQETGYGLVGIGGESRSGDANGQYIRVQAGGGTNTIKIPAFGGGGVGFPTESQVGVAPFDLMGAMPRIQDSAKTRFRPNVRCETQEPPNLAAGRDEIPFDENTSDASLPDAAGMLSELDSRQVERAAQRIGIDETTAEALGTLAGEER